MKTNRLAAVLALSALAALACSKSETKNAQPSANHEPDPATTSTAVAYTGKIDSEKAQAIFNERCAACHGTDGNGKGPAAAALNPKPRNYTDKAWQAGVTDEQL